jgi:hypothetical protein
MVELDSRVEYIRSHVLAESTKKTYSSHFSMYKKFCLAQGISLVPITQRDLARYIAYLSYRLKFSSIQNYLSVVRLLHLESGYSNPISTYYITSTQKGLKRVLGDARGQKLPITPSILLSIRQLLSFTNPLHVSFWAVCLVAFFSFFRKSNLLPENSALFNPQQHLSVPNISFTNQGALISVSWSKTIQYQNRTLTIPLPFMPASPLCPSTALWLSIQQSTPQGVSPFQYHSVSGLTFLTYPHFLHLLKSFLQQLGINPGYYSGHSFRRGGASFALQAGANPELVQAQGDWRSEAYKLYIDPSLEARRQVASLMTVAIQNLSP